MTAPLVTLDAFDFEAQPYPVLRALGGLMEVHQLPKFQRVYGVRNHGWKVIVVALDPEHAEEWRAALGAPGYDANPSTPGQMMTERFWFSTWVRLVYSHA